MCEGVKRGERVGRSDDQLEGGTDGLRERKKWKGREGMIEERSGYEMGGKVKDWNDTKGKGKKGK